MSTVEKMRDYLTDRPQPVPPDSDRLPPPVLPDQLIRLLVRLHELRWDANATLKEISETALAIQDGGTGLGPARVDEALAAKRRAAVPKSAIRDSLVSLYCKRAGGDDCEQTITREINGLVDAAEQALRPENPGKSLTSGNVAEPEDDEDEPGDDDGPVVEPHRRRAALGVRVRVAAFSVFLIFLLGFVAFATTDHVALGAVTAHDRFEQCITQNALVADPQRGPQRTLAEWAHIVAAPTPENTSYTVRNRAAALQATVVFTPSAQAAREVLNADAKFDNSHHIFNSDYTVNDTTVVTPQFGGPNNVS
jgi:hypothetical protein